MENNHSRRRPELLAPAGDFEKLRAAVLYGADAVYLAGERFGMRAASGNFTLEEYKNALEFAHERGVRVYLTLNTMPRFNEYDSLIAYLKELSDCPPDALIISDMGVWACAREYLPGVEVHVSTQCSTVSDFACREYHRLGAARVVLARELSLDEIINIRRRIPDTLELECFIHGSMCVSYSGRCLLSNYFTGRDSNRGQCAQPCRWSYELREGQRPDAPFPVEQDESGTFFMSSRDMCMIEHIPELVESGISSFKIEGRVKSAYYAAVVTNAYRMAIDAYLRSPEAYSFDGALMDELNSVSHREYGTGYYFSAVQSDANVVTQPGYIREKAYLATALSYDQASGRARFIQRNKLLEGAAVELISPGRTGRAFTISSLTNEAGESIDSTPHPSMLFDADVPFEVKPGDILRASFN